MSLAQLVLTMHNYARSGVRTPATKKKKKKDNIQQKLGFGFDAVTTYLLI